MCSTFLVSLVLNCDHQDTVPSKSMHPLSVTNSDSITYSFLSLYANLQFLSFSESQNNNDNKKLFIGVCLRSKRCLAWLVDEDMCEEWIKGREY